MCQLLFTLACVRASLGPAVPEERLGKAKGTESRFIWGELGGPVEIGAWGFQGLERQVIDLGHQEMMEGEGVRRSRFKC